MKGQMKFQIGKSSVTEGAIESLNLAFKTHKIVRISVLKNSIRDRMKIKEMAEELVSKLDGNFNFRIIGFTIILKKVGIRARSKV